MFATKNINDFVKAYHAKKGESFTHTSLAGGSFNIPDSALNEFYKIYKIAFLSDGIIPLHLSEKHIATGPLLIDLDFRQTDDGRKYTLDLITRFLKVYTSYVVKYFDLKDDVEYFILEKGNGPRVSKNNIYKDGVHIIAPRIVSVPEIQEAVRNDFIANELDFFADLGFSNPLEDIIDEGVIARNNWLMYGSNKPIDGDMRYLATHKVSISPTTLETVTQPVDPEDVSFINLFSIRRKTPESSYTAKGQQIIQSTKILAKEEESFHMTSVSDNRSIITSTRQDVKTLTDEQLATALVDILDRTRADKYDSWIKVGLCLHHISSNLLDKWIEFSKKSSKYVEGECNAKWRDFVNVADGLTLGTLRMWARQDNPTEYQAIVKNNVLHNVLRSISGTNTDVACVVHDMYGNAFKCVKQPNVWYEFKNHRWCQIDNAYTLRMLLSRDVFNMYVTASQLYQNKAQTYDETHEEEVKSCLDKAAKFLKISKQLRMASSKDAIIKECAEMFYDSKFFDRIDDNKKIIVFENGVYDLETMMFRDGIPDDYATFTTGYDFVLEDNYEIQQEIMNFMLMISENEGCTEYLLKVCAYMLTGEKFMELLWFFCGKGRNGKGTLCTLLDKTFGQYYYEPDVSIVTTTKKNSSGPNPEMAKAKGKRILCASEPDDEDKNSKFRVNKLKQLRGNDAIQARALYSNSMEFKPQFGMIFQMNDKPDLSKADDAIAKTLKIINFPWQFVTNPTESYQRQADPSLKFKFTNDVNYRQQFMRILIKYYTMYIHGSNKALEDTPEVAAATREYMEDNNPVAVWLKDTFEYTGQRSDSITCEAMRNEFNAITRKGFSGKKFGDAMSGLGHKSVNILNKKCYVGFKRIGGVGADDDDLQS